MKKIWWITIASSLAACGSSSPRTQSPATEELVQQRWSVAPGDGATCLAVASCEEQPGVECTAPAPVGAVRFTETTCLPGAQSWTIGRTASLACILLDVRCQPGERCEPARREILCPPDMRVATAEPEPPIEDKVQLMPRAQSNLERGRRALAARKLDHAKAYFEFVIEQFPDSQYVDEARAGLRDVEAARAGG